MALTRKRTAKKDFVLSAGIQWKHKHGTGVWDGTFVHPKYQTPINCKIENAGKEMYKWSFTTPGPDIVCEIGVTEGPAFWYAADDVRAAINQL